MGVSKLKIISRISELFWELALILYFPDCGTILGGGLKFLALVDYWCFEMAQDTAVVSVAQLLFIRLSDKYTVLQKLAINLAAVFDGLSRYVQAPYR